MQIYWRRPSRKFRTFFIALTYLVLPSGALWPFDTFLPKRFSGNALLGAGSLGVDDDGRIIAFGDFNGDQLCVLELYTGVACPYCSRSMDLVGLGSDQQTLSTYQWSHGKLCQMQCYANEVTCKVLSRRIRIQEIISGPTSTTSLQRCSGRLHATRQAGLASYEPGTKIKSACH